MSAAVSGLLLGPALSFVVTIGTLVVLLHTGLAHRLALDMPNQRSLHADPIPRTGGIAVVTGLLSAWILAGPFNGLVALLTIVLAAGSFIDDRRGLPIVLRFGVHCAAAVLFVGYLLPDIHPGTAALLSIGIVWVINLYNFMDGSDGLAGGMALSGFGFMGLAAWNGGGYELASWCWCVSAGALAFLCFNFHPARVFLGDAGSIPLGFLASAFGLLGWGAGHWPLWFPLLVFSAFVVDASVTLLRRVARGEKFWRAHREHYYQRLVQIGWGHRNTAFAEYAVMVASGMLAVVALDQPAGMQAFMIGAWIALLAVLMFTVDRHWNRYRESEKC